MFLVANPDVPSVRNAQRLLERVRELGASRRARAPAAQSRGRAVSRFRRSRSRRALGHPIHHTFPSDYKTVSTALNSGVPLALAGNSDIATQFDQFTRQRARSERRARRRQPRRRSSLLGLERIASIW